MAPRQTALGRLLQQRRESAGYSRARVGELVGIKPGTIEGWELGRVARPPIHDVLRMAHFLGISPDEISAAVFEDAGDVAPAPDEPERQERKKGRRRRPEGAVPLLEAGFRLFGWKSDAEAASALNATAEQVAPLALGCRADDVRRLPHAHVDDRRRGGRGDEGRRGRDRGSLSGGGSARSPHADT